MPITVSCGCGKVMQVSDEWAGKRAECPGCKRPLTVPKPEAEEEIIAAEVVEEKRPSRITNKPKPKIEEEIEDVEEVVEVEPVEDDRPRSRRRRDEDDEDDRPRRKRGTGRVDDARPLRRMKKDESSGGGFGTINAGVIGGVFMMVLAVVWFFGALIYADRIFFYPPILFVLGLIAVVKGMVGG